MIDARLVSALSEQLARREGARIGWKLGVGDRERIGGHIAIGHLTSATLLEPGSSFAGATETLHADAELAVEIGPGGSIMAYRPALEIVDLAEPPREPEAVVAENVFHRAVAFGRRSSAPPASGATGTLVVNGERRASAELPHDVEERVEEAGRILGAVGERLEAGDLVITGSIVQVPVAAGDDVVADLGPLGTARLSIA